MRPLPRPAALITLAVAVTLAGCGTKTSLRLPPPEQRPASAAVKAPTQTLATASKPVEPRV